MPAVDCDRMHMPGVLQRVIEAGRVPVMAVPYEGRWGEVDSEEDLDVDRDDPDSTEPGPVARTGETGGFIKRLMRRRQARLQGRPPRRFPPSATGRPPVAPAPSPPPIGRG
jgi:hypothetical protein